MKVRIVGKKRTQFTDRESGELKQFATLYYTYNAPMDTDIRTSEGLYAESVSIPFKTYDDVPTDCDAFLDFDKNGKLLNFDLL